MNLRKILIYFQLLCLVFLLPIFVSGQPPSDFDGPKYPRESGIPGFEHKARQFQVGPGGDLAYTIPLLTVPGKIPLEIDLSYTSGIKVDQSASWVGLGWSLGEFAVSRVTVSGDDGTVVRTTTAIVRDRSETICAHSSVKVNDAYQVIIPGRSIKFMNYGDERNPKFAPMNFSADSLYCNPYQIAMYADTANDPSDQDTFTLITSDGTRYIFGYPLKRTGRDWDNFQDWDCDVSTGETDDGIRPTVNHMWLLSAILSPDYVDGTSPNPDDDPLNSINDNKGYWIVFTYSWDNSGQVPTRKKAYYGMWSSSGGSYNDTTEVTWPYRIITPTHVLQYVTAPKPGKNYRCLRSGPAGANNECLDEDYPNNFRIRDRELVGIRLYKRSDSGPDPTGAILTEFRFVYRSGISPYYDDLKAWNERNWGGEITLVKVYQTGADSFLVGTHDVTKPPHPYEFSYEQNPYFTETSESDPAFEMWNEGETGGNCETNRDPHNWGVPSLPIWKRDFFGYLDTISTDTLEQTSWQLTEVVTPTGARITFEWQTDSYKYTDPAYTPPTIEFRNNGGTRIKRIITYPENWKIQDNPADTIEYEYGENADGFGYPNSMPPTYFKWKNQIEPCFPISWHFNPDNVSHMIYYPKITEIYRNKGTIKGKKETYYSTSKTVGIDSLRSHTYSPAGLICYPTPEPGCDYVGWWDKVLNVYWDRTALMGVLDSVILKDKDGNVISKEKKYYANVLKFADTATYNDNHIPEWDNNDYILSSSYFIRLDSTVVIKDDVKYVNSYEYDPTYGLPIKVTEHGSGKNRVTTYEYAYNVYPQMKSKHILDEIYRKKILEEVGPNQYLSAQDSTEWKDFDDQPSMERWYPYKNFSWRDDNDNQIVESGEQILVQTFNTYDSYGNLVEGTDANSIKSTTKYGLNREPVLQAKNASTNTVFYNDFEHGATYDGWALNNGTLVSEQVFTGENALKVIYNGSETKGASHTVSDPNTYHFSAWVRCDVVGRAKIVLKNLSDQTVAQVANATIGKWELLRVTKPVSSGQQLEAYTAAAGGTATAYFDELRLAPDNALITATVYDPLMDVSATSDENGLTKHFIYDAQQRLIIETDETSSPIYGRAYSYSVNRLGCGQSCIYQEWAPNSILEIKSTEKGYVDDFSSNSLGNYTQSGAVYDTDKKRVKLPYGAFIKLPFNFSNVAVSFDFVKTTPFNPINPNQCPTNPSNDWECCDSDGNLEIFLHSTSAGDYYKCMLQKNVSGTPKIRLTNSLNPGGTLSDFGFSITTQGIGSYGPSVLYNFYMIRLGPHIYIFINGHLANYVSNYEPDVLQNFNQIEIASHCDSFYIDNLVVYKNPTVTRYLYDGLGNQFQTLRDDSSATYATETVYDIFNRPTLVTKEKVYSHPDSAFLNCKVSLVNENKISWELGSPMTTASDVRNYYNNPDSGLPICDNYPYHYTQLLPEPDNRTIEQSYTGWDFRPGGGHTTNFVYRTNSAGEIAGFPSGTLNVTRQKDENGNFVHKYLDQLNNLAAVIVDSGGLSLQTTTSYDILGNPQTVTPPKGSTYNSTFTYNTLSQLVYKTTPDNGTTKYVYDLKGNLKYTQDANQQPSGRFTARIYDALGRLIVEGVELDDFTWTTTPPDLNWPYGADPNEWKIRRYYDVDYINSGANFVKGQLTKEEANWDSDATAEFIALYRYDESGNLTEERFTIEGLSEKIVKFHYNSQGQLDTITYPDNSKVTYTYDNLGRLWKIGNGTTAHRYATYTYWPGGMAKSIVFKNASGGTVQTLDYSYNTRDWLDSINNGDIGGTDKFGLAIFYQRPSGTSYYNGNISKMVSKMSPLGAGDLFSFEYTYDKANRLTLSNDSATTKYDELLLYDENGNIFYLEIRDTAHAYNYFTNNNRLNYVSNWHSANNYKYDNNGNMVKDVSKSDTLTYEYRNLSTHVKLDNGSPPNYMDFYYDAAGQRVKKYYLYHFIAYYSCCKCDPEAPEGGPITEAGGFIEPDALCNPPCYWSTCSRLDSTYETTYYIYYGDNIIAEYDKNGAVSAKYVYAGGERIAKDVGGNVYYYLKDHLGSTRVVVDEGGVVKAKYNNYAYGDELNSTVTTGTDYRYTGKELDEESGFNLYYYGARFYDARIGRFVSVEPQAERYPSLSPYVYAGDNPIILYDPDGNAIDIVVDVVSIVYDVADIVSTVREGKSVSLQQVGSLVGDIAGAAIPGLTGVGAIIRTGAKADKAVDAVKTAKKAEQLATNKAAGQKAEGIVQKELQKEGTEILGKNAAIKTSQGIRKPDFTVKDPKTGEIKNIEVKSGKAQRNPSQKAKDQEIGEKGGKFVGKNAPKDLKDKKVKVQTEERRPEQ